MGLSATHPGGWVQAVACGRGLTAAAAWKRAGRWRKPRWRRRAGLPWRRRGFLDRPPAGQADRRHLRRVLGRIGAVADRQRFGGGAGALPAAVLQARTVSARAAGQRRLGAAADVVRILGARGLVLPVETQPLLRWRMAQAERGRDIYSELAKFGRERRPYVDGLLARIAAEGPTGAGAWEGREGRGLVGLERHQAGAGIPVLGGAADHGDAAGLRAGVRPPERVLPAAILATPTPAPADAQRALLRIAARRSGSRRRPTCAIISGCRRQRPRASGNWSRRGR